MKKSVLIVDDEAAARESLARVLSSHGYGVRSAANSADAMRELSVQGADVVLLDLDLPHVPGDSLAAFLRLRHPRTQIIFMSGQYDMVNPQRFGENTLYFRKPLNIRELLDTLEAQVSTQGASSQM